MRGLSISLAWEETRTILARDGGLFAAVALALIVLPQIVVIALAPAIGADSVRETQILFLVAIVIGLAGQVALNRLAVGPSLTVGSAITRGFARLLPLLAALLLVSIVLIVVVALWTSLLGSNGLVDAPVAGRPPPVGLLLAMIVLTALLSAVFQLTIPIAAVESGGPIRILSRSWQLARHHYLRLLAFVVFVLAGIGLVLLAGQFVFGSIVVLLLGPPRAGSVSALLLGTIVATIQAAFTVVSAVMLARIYLQLAESNVQPGVPNSGT